MFQEIVIFSVCVLYMSTVLGCQVYWNCDVCTSHPDCRYFKNKERFMCLRKIIPSMRPKFIYDKIDCLRESFTK
jgi:hypothetical protein